MTNNWAHDSKVSHIRSQIEGRFFSPSLVYKRTITDLDSETTDKVINGQPVS